MVDSMQVKMVSILNATPTADAITYRPFQIGMAANEILKLWGFRIRLSPSGINVTRALGWSLIVKNERAEEDPDTSIGRPVLRNEDHDMIIRGEFTEFLDAGARKEDLPWRDEVWFRPVPFVIPRSPSLEVISTDSSSILFAAELYYEKIAVSDVAVLQLMKQYVGRKQTALANVARVIDE